MAFSGSGFSVAIYLSLNSSIGNTGHRGTDGENVLTALLGAFIRSRSIDEIGFPQVGYISLILQYYLTAKFFRKQIYLLDAESCNEKRMIGGQLFSNWQSCIFPYLPLQCNEISIHTDTYSRIDDITAASLRRNEAKNERDNPPASIEALEGSPLLSLSTANGAAESRLNDHFLLSLSLDEPIRGKNQP